MMEIIKDSFIRDGLVRSLCIIWILFGMYIGVILCMSIDAIYGLEILKDSKIDVNGVKYRIINLEKTQNNKITLIVNNLKREEFKKRRI